MNSGLYTPVQYNEWRFMYMRSKGGVGLRGLRVRGAVFEREGRACPGGAFFGTGLSGGRWRWAPSRCWHGGGGVIPRGERRRLTHCRDNDDFEQALRYPLLEGIFKSIL